MHNIKMKKLIISILILSLALSQTFNFNGGQFTQNNNQNTGPPPIANCVKQQGSECLECIKDYEFNTKTGQC